MVGGFGGHVPQENFKIMHLSFVSPIAPHTGIGEDNRGFDLVILANSPLLEYAACYIKSPLKPQQCLYRNQVETLIHRIISIVKVNACTIHKIYHIMSFTIELTNCMPESIAVLFSDGKVNYARKYIKVKFPTIQGQNFMIK